MGAVAFVGLTIGAMGYGVIQIPFRETISLLWNIIFGLDAGDGIHRDVLEYVRLPYAVSAFLIGASLSVCGVVMQAVLKNPLADPYLLGISSGAGLGAIISIVLGISVLWGYSGIGVFAFLGALIVSVIIVGLSSIGRKSNSLFLLLAGFSVNAMCSAIINLSILIMADTQKTRTVQFWLMGVLSFKDWETTLLLGIITMGGIAFFLTQTRVLDVMLIGDELALTMGQNIAFWRKIYILVISVMVGSVVYVAGMVGFVGLLVPNIVRFFVGSGHGRLLPISAILGGWFLVWADILGRTVITGNSLPLGIVSATVGIPLLIGLLIFPKYREVS